MHFRIKLAAAAVAALCSSTVVWADQTLYVAANGGSTEKVMKEKLFPAFEKEHPGVKVMQVTGTSTQSLAKLQAQRNNPEIGVAILDDGPMWQAMQLGFCSDVNPGTYKDLYSMANIGGKAMGVGLVATGLAYNTEAFKEMGLSAPDSWEDLLNPKLKQKVVIPSITNTYGLHTLVVFARLRGGGEKNIEPGFKAMIEEAQPNVLSWEPAPGKLAELFQNRSVLLAAHGSGRVQALKNTGFPVEMVYPKEGAVSLQIAACAIEKSPEPELAQAFLEFLSRPETQTILAQSEGWGPTNKTVELSPELAKQVPYGADAVENMLVVDWTTVNPKRNEWTTRWNRTVER